MKRYSLEVRGKCREWSFPIWANPEWVENWREDGLHIDEVVNVVPQWYIDLGLPARLWCIAQDALNKIGL